MNFPNKLTIARVLMIPFFMVFIVFDLVGSPFWCRIIAASIFAVASLTDMIDGKYARKHNMITDFGKFLDPLADKFLVFGALFAICISGYSFNYETLLSQELMRQLCFWITVVVVFRELAVTSMRLVVAKSAGTVVAASILGKLKTNSQIICVLLLLLEPAFLPFTKGILSVLAMALMLVMTVVSGLDYIKTYWKFLDPRT